MTTTPLTPADDAAVVAAKIAAEQRSCMLNLLMSWLLLQPQSQALPASAARFAARIAALQYCCCCSNDSS
jgi:hypothetical protein